MNGFHALMDRDLHADVVGAETFFMLVGVLHQAPWYYLDAASIHADLMTQFNVNRTVCLRDYCLDDPSWASRRLLNAQRPVPLRMHPDFVVHRRREFDNTVRRRTRRASARALREVQRVLSDAIGKMQLQMGDGATKRLYKALAFAAPEDGARRPYRRVSSLPFKPFRVNKRRDLVGHQLAELPWSLTPLPGPSVSRVFQGIEVSADLMLTVSGIPRTLEHAELVKLLHDAIPNAPFGSFVLSVGRISPSTGRLRSRSGCGAMVQDKQKTRMLSCTADMMECRRNWPEMIGR